MAVASDRELLRYQGWAALKHELGEALLSGEVDSDTVVQDAMIRWSEEYAVDMDSQEAMEMENTIDRLYRAVVENVLADALAKMDCPDLPGE